MFSYQRFAESKPKLLIAVILTTVGALSIPVLLPHLHHGAHIWHLLLHTAGIILSVFLAILSVNAYYKMRTKKMIITTIAFMIFTCAELVQLLDATQTHVYNILESPSEISHLMMLGMIGLLALAIFRRD
uniref:Uncharacterized protein n=1 Tax=uncultured marine thaumarchaeote KM3_18_D11 TaxID=1456075 RepID=A0A075GPZ5_9ARCH|nr:hypothetical protein [uncultured marine thaumarchaeote KM3_18_D11]